MRGKEKVAARGADTTTGGVSSRVRSFVADNNNNSSKQLFTMMSSSLPALEALPLLTAALLLLLASSAVPTTDAEYSMPSTQRGLTDDSQLATRKGVPDASLCESGDAGHRRATNMGDAFLKRGNTLRAEACYLGALHYKSDFPMALYGLGEVHSREKRDGLAREAYQLAIDVWPVYVDAHIALGDLHHRAGRPKKAEASYDAAVKAAPTDPIAWESLVGLLRLHHGCSLRSAPAAPPSYSEGCTHSLPGVTRLVIKWTRALKHKHVVDWSEREPYWLSSRNLQNTSREKCQP
jgi:tetratricopeptide (TPR) repeat protein